MARRIVLTTVVSGNIPGPFSNVNDRIMLMSDAVMSEGPKGYTTVPNIISKPEKQTGGQTF